jgi:CheY-like chemotaxis protein
MKKILVIDDEPFVARLIGAALDTVGIEHDLEYSSDGAQGKIMAAQAGFDLVTLDLQMPLMGGVEALKEMKQNPKSAGVPVVVVTAQQDPAFHQQLMDLGAAAVVTKPFDPADLGDVLSRILAGEEFVPDVGMPGSGLRPMGG